MAPQKDVNAAPGMTVRNQRDGKRPFCHSGGLPALVGRWKYADVLLLVEVADTSVEPDHRVKIPLYARHGVSEVWLVDLPRETITACRDPKPDGYRTVEVYRRGDSINPLAFSDLTIAFDKILG